ncbi:MAG: acetylglutamate kinase [Candidatus Kryptoniota bacterium]
MKVGGNEIDDSEYLDGVSHLVKMLYDERHSVFIVHGGGKEVTQLLNLLDVATNFIDGVRYTDQKTLDIVEMTLSGLINKRIVRSLLSHHIPAIGISGVDGGILTARRILRNGEDIGFVGEVIKVKTQLLEKLSELGIVVVSPISQDSSTDGRLNVNADFAAAAIAAFLESELVLFLTNVAGVMDSDNLIGSLKEDLFKQMKKNGTVSGGMIPKIESSFSALKGGAKRAFIVNIDGAIEIANGKPAGTQVLI